MKITPAQVKTKKHYGAIQLLVRGQVLQNLWRKKDRAGTYYESDTFSNRYKTIADAKFDTAGRWNDNYWGPTSAMSNPYSKRAKFIHKRIKSARKFAKKSFRTLRIGKHGKRLRVACPKGKFKSGRCSVGMKAQGLLTPRKYVGIARASKYRSARKIAANGKRRR